MLDSDQVAMLTGVAIQDDETFKSEGDLFPRETSFILRCNKATKSF